MKYFSGLGLKNDWHLFKSLIKNFGFSLNKYDIVGFDYGAILALQYAEQKIKKHERIGKVILLSPTFFLQNLLEYTHKDSTDACRHLMSNTLHTTNKNSYILRHLDKPSYDIKNTKLTNTSIHRMCSKNFITHMDYEKIATKSIPISYITWNRFVRQCYNNFFYYPNMYMKIVYNRYGLIHLQHNTWLYCGYNKKCRVFTHTPNITHLGNLLSYKYNKIDKIAKKSNLFVTFLSENDKIINSKTVVDFFSQFGICLVLKNCNYILQQKLKNTTMQ